MANVGFKLGTQANVDKLLVTPGTSVVEGSFYLTSDTHRLYIGQKASADDANAQLFSVNEGVVTVNTTAELPKPSGAESAAYAGRFYYVTTGNILCVYNGSSWVQINPNTNTTVTGNKVEVSAASDVATVKNTITSSDGKSLPASYTITGANGIKITGTGTALTITGDTYTLSGTVANNTATLKLDSTNTANDSSVAIKGGSNVTVTQDTTTKVITVAAKDTTNASVTGAAAASGFDISVTDSAGAKKTGNIDPAIKVGKGNPVTAKFANGTATLDVYSTADIDDKMKALNAMVYKGTLGKDGTIAALPTTNVSIGDTYLVANPTTVGTTMVYPGGLLIARGTEDKSTGYITGTITWDVVQSTKDADTTYVFQAVDGGIKMHSSTGADVGSLKVAGGTDISVTSKLTDNTADQTLTLNHKAVTRADGTDTALTQSKNTSTDVTVVSGVTTSATGHVTGIKTRKITLVDSNTTMKSVTNTVTAASNVATVSTKVAATLGTGGETAQTGTLKIASTSMAVTGSSNQVNIDLTWGTF